ncbi:MAG: DUF2909 domain-containing protein [Proteobacteria bacterium]|nr:DUF2909 domain-containing protein [Pseudomonadota bacterium]MCH9758602.1 DUF2909 domain-containing protein [Pseudomonadota bacterium]
MRFVFIFLLCFVVINLFIGLFHIIRGKSKNSNQVVRSLTIRVAISILLFAAILITVYLTSNHLK